MTQETAAKPWFLRNSFASLLAAAIVIVAADIPLFGLTPVIRTIVSHPFWTFSVFGFLAVFAILTAIRHPGQPERPNGYAVIAMTACGLFIVAEFLVLAQVMGSVPVGYSQHLATAMATISGDKDIPACDADIQIPDNLDARGRTRLWLRYTSFAGVCALSARAGYRARYSGAAGTYQFSLLPNSLRTGWVFNSVGSSVGVATCHEETGYFDPPSAVA